MAKLSNEDFREKVIENVLEGGYSSIVDIVDLIPIKKLRENFDFLEEDDEEEDVFLDDED